MLNLQIGDEVIIRARDWMSLGRVLSLTPTQVVVRRISHKTKEELVGEYRFNKVSGRLIGGDSWTSTSVVKADEPQRSQVVETLERSRLVGVFGRYDWKRLSLEKLRNIEKIIASP